MVGRAEAAQVVRISGSERRRSSRPPGSNRLTVTEIEDGQERFFPCSGELRAARGTRPRPSTTSRSIKLEQKVGEVVFDLDILREAAKGRAMEPTTSGE